MKKAFALSVAAAALICAGSAQQAHAEFIITVSQVGSNVVATGTGSLNLAGLTDTMTETGSMAGFELKADGISMVSGDSFLVYSGTITGPSNFGTLLSLELASISSGDYVGFVDYGGTEQVRVPVGYTSGSSLSDSMTFDNKTIAGPDLTPGTYT